MFEISGYLTSLTRGRPYTTASPPSYTSYLRGAISQCPPANSTPRASNTTTSKDLFAQEPEPKARERTAATNRSSPKYHMKWERRVVLCSSLYISSDSVTSIFYHTPRLVPLSSRIACPREDGGGDPSFPSLPPPPSLVIPSVSLFPLALYPPVHRRAGSRTALPPPLFPFPLQGGRLGWGCTLPLSSRIRGPIFPLRIPLPVGAGGSGTALPPPLFPFPLQGGRLGWGCTLPCPRE